MRALSVSDLAGAGSHNWWRELKMRRVFGLLAAGVLLLSACSSGGEEAAGPEASTPPENSSPPNEAPATTEAVDEGLAAVLDGEPPSTTVSDDPDEQAAADALHWSFQTFDACQADTKNCVLADFEHTDTSQALENIQEIFAERKRVGQYSETNRPSEFTVLWARKSTTTDGVIGVLTCERNYYIRYNRDGTVENDTSPVALALTRVIQNDEGQWLASDHFVIDEFQPESEGGDQCSTYDGNEVPDTQFNELIA